MRPLDFPLQSCRLRLRSAVLGVQRLDSIRALRRQRLVDCVVQYHLREPQAGIEGDADGLAQHVTAEVSGGLGRLEDILVGCQARLAQEGKDGGFARGREAICPGY